MADDFPGIEPTTFDTIVIGTGLQESILAAAAASAGHSVLHLDPCPFYGLHWTSLSLDDFTAWAAAGGRLPFTPPSFTQINGSAKPFKVPDDEDLEIEPVTNRVLYSEFVISSLGSKPLGPSRDFNLDIAGPKLAFCGGPLVDLLMKASASNYLEFKSVEASYIWSGGQGLIPVSGSCASIFQDRTLSLLEKRHLMRFCKLVQNYGDAEELNSEVLENRFVDFLDQQRLPSSIKSKEDARQVFDEMPYRDLVSWRGLILIYAHNGFSEEVLRNLREMQCSAAIWPLLGPAENDVVSFRGASTPCKPNPAIKIACCPAREKKKQAQFVLSASCACTSFLSSQVCRGKQNPDFSASFQILIVLLFGKTLLQWVSSLDLVQDLKQILEFKMGIPSASQ